MTKIIMLIIIISLVSISTASAMNSEPSKFSEHGEGGLPNNPFIDAIRNSLNALSIQITCQYGYTICYEQSNIYGNAQAIARVYLSEPYVEGTNLYINYNGDAQKYYVYRGLSSWGQINCDSGGCSGGEAIRSTGKYLVASAPSTSQQSVVFVMWDYDSYNGYWTWTAVYAGWLSPFSYILQVPVATTITVTPASSSIDKLSTVQLSAVIKDQNGVVMSVTPVWSSSNDAIATVSPTGLVTGKEFGTVTITSVYDTKSGSSTIQVNAPPTTINSPADFTLFLPEMWSFLRTLFPSLPASLR